MNTGTGDMPPDLQLYTHWLSAPRFSRFKRLKLHEWILVAGLLAYPHASHADTITFPEDELATESVLPVFDEPVATKNRTILSAGRFEIGAGGTDNLTEPFFNPYGFDITASYHFDEENGFNFYGAFFSSSPSSYSKQLNSIQGSTTQLHLEYAPAPKYLLLANYQYTAFYGKLSLTKDYVMNLHLYGLLGIGEFAIGDSNNPALSFGLGQKFYFSPTFALRFDLQFLLYQGPNVVTGNLSNATSTQSASSFSKRTFFSSVLSVSGVYLIPHS